MGLGDTLGVLPPENGGTGTATGLTGFAARDGRHEDISVFGSFVVPYDGLYLVWMTSANQSTVMSIDTGFGGKPSVVASATTSEYERIAMGIVPMTAGKTVQAFPKTEAPAENLFLNAGNLGFYASNANGVMCGICPLIPF